jgi:hypothetical protein
MTSGHIGDFDMGSGLHREEIGPLSYSLVLSVVLWGFRKESVVWDIPSYLLVST